MRIRLIIILLFSITGLQGQIQNEDIAGTYKLPNSNPEGGQSIIVFENGTFITFFFGGVLKGTYQINDIEINFKTTTNPKFVVYGRNLASLKDSTNITFKVEGNSYFRLYDNKTEMKPVFNESANCFRHPYMKKVKGLVKNFEFAEKDYNSDKNLYNVYYFNNDKSYNDLMIIQLSDQYTNESKFTALYQENGLLFNDKLVKRAPNKFNSEDKLFIYNFMKNELLPNELVYGKEFFPRYDNPTEEQLKPYSKIKSSSIVKEKVKVQSNSLFTAKCD